MLTPILLLLQINDEKKRLDTLKSRIELADVRNPFSVHHKAPIFRLSLPLR